MRGRAVLAALALLATLFVGLWTWRLAGQDVPVPSSLAALQAMNRPADVTLKDRTGALLGRRSGGTPQPIDLKALPPYVASAFATADDEPDLRLARLLIPAAPDRLGRPLQEQTLARRLRQRLPPSDLLALYLARADLAGVYGLDAAAETYFAKPAAHLTLAEAAFLAALEAGPMQGETDAAMRTEAVLARMLAAGAIQPAAFDLARREPVRLATVAEGQPELAAALDWAAAEARRLAPARTPLIVTLSLDPFAQQAAVEALRNGRTPDAIIAALDQEGDVAALAASRDHRFGGAGRLNTPRPLGEAGAFLTQAIALEGGMSAGDVSAAAHGVLAAKVSAAKLDAAAQRFGLTLAEGGMGPAASAPGFAAALQAFRTGGRLSPPQMILKIADMNGKILYRRPENLSTEVYAPPLSRQMTAMMRSPTDSTALGHPAAAVRGAAGDGEDGWSAGFTADLTAAVWSRNGAAAPGLWEDFMRRAHKGKPARPLNGSAAKATPRAQFYTSLAEDFDRLASQP